MRLVWQLLAIAAISFLGGQALAATQQNPWLNLTIGLTTAIAATLTYAWIIKRTEHRPATEISRHDATSRISTGIAIGTALFTLVIVNIAFLDGYTVTGLANPTSAIGLFGFMAAAAVTEELLYRGILFRIIEQHTGTWIALTATGTLFGLSHLLNPNATWWGATAIAIEAGGMLTAAYIATRQLWIPIGIHFGWNFAASGIFSTEVSGNGTPQGLLNATTHGPTILTGGDFGPEASLYSVAFCATVTTVFLWIAHRRANLTPLRRRNTPTPTTATLTP